MHRKRALFSLSAALRLDELVSQRLPLDRVNEAFDALLTGELARTVILP